MNICAYPRCKFLIHEGPPRLNRVPDRLHILPQNHGVPRTRLVGSISFFHIESTLSITAAPSACSLKGSGWMMATIADDAENAAAQAIIGGNTWIGLNAVGRANNWVWSSESPSQYRNWGTGEPNNFRTERYAEMLQATGKWSSATSSGNRRVLCSVSLMCSNRLYTVDIG